MNLPRQWAQRWVLRVGMLSRLIPGQAQQAPAGWQTHGPFAGGLAGITSPYRARAVPPTEFANSARIDALMRAGRLYLSLQDAIALALENNLDIELQRYGPRIAQTDLERAEAGGTLRGVSTAIQPTSDSSAGSVTGTASTGTPIPSLEPALVGQLNWSHRSQPQINSFSTGANYLVSKARLANFGFQQGFLTGTTVSPTRDRSSRSQVRGLPPCITRPRKPRCSATLPRLRRISSLQVAAYRRTNSRTSPASRKRTWRGPTAESRRRSRVAPVISGIRDLCLFFCEVAVGVADDGGFGVLAADGRRA